MKELASCFDIDGVLIDNEARYKWSLEKIGGYGSLREAKKDIFWKYFLSEEALKYDKPRRIGILLLNIAREKGYKIVIFTGRPLRLKYSTIRQLSSFNIYFDEIYFRRDNDFRRDFDVKLEIIRGLLYKYSFIEIHDDEREVLEVLRKYLPKAKLYYHISSTYIILNYP